MKRFGTMNERINESETVVVNGTILNKLKT